MGNVINFHLPAADVQRAATFYREVFGWELTPFEGSLVPYVVGKSSHPDEPGIEIAITARTHMLQHPTPTIEVADIDSAMTRLSMLGGQQSTVHTIPGVGRFGYAKDPEGNLIALLERVKAAT
ncbi:MAG: VOC family protein [Vulcanimicrobiaceae bacterium]